MDLVGAAGTDGDWNQRRRIEQRLAGDVEVEVRIFAQPDRDIPGPLKNHAGGALWHTGAGFRRVHRQCAREDAAVVAQAAQHIYSFQVKGIGIGDFAVLKSTSKLPTPMLMAPAMRENSRTIAPQRLT